MFPMEAFRITSRDLEILRYIQNTCTLKFISHLCVKEHEKILYNTFYPFMYLRR
jgi:hypothetical protein